LSDGRVLVVGGDGASASESVEVYNPATGTWVATGHLVMYRREHSAVRLADGRVLVMGGTNEGGTVLASAEVYNPATGTWASTGGMAHPRRAFIATALPDGRVLVVGGLVDDGDECLGFNCLTSVEVYNPVTGTWTSTGGMSRALPEKRRKRGPEGMYPRVIGSWMRQGQGLLETSSHVQSLHRETTRRGLRVPQERGHRAIAPPRTGRPERQW
jgi:hypothetical protein